MCLLTENEITIRIDEWQYIELPNQSPPTHTLCYHFVSQCHWGLVIRALVNKIQGFSGPLGKGAQYTHITHALSIILDYDGIS